MAAKEPYDYLTTMTPDYTAVTLNIGHDVDPQQTMMEEGRKNIIIHLADDGSEERIAISKNSTWYFRINYNALTESAAGIILDYYHDTAKACGELYSFYFLHPKDTHTYVVRFAGPSQRLNKLGNIYGYAPSRLKILGKKAD